MHYILYLCLAFADDTVIITTTKAELENAFKWIEISAKEADFKVKLNI